MRILVRAALPFNLIRHLEFDTQHINDRFTINQPRQNRLVIHGDITFRVGIGCLWGGTDVCARCGFQRGDGISTLVLESDSLGDLDKSTPARHPILLVYQEL